MGFERERAAANFISASRWRRNSLALWLAILGTSCALPASLGRAGGKLSDVLRGQETITTSIADVNLDLVLPDSFSPTTFSSLASLPRGPHGGFLLSPGAYTLRVRSYCLHAGRHGPTKGKGYLYAPLKGGRASLIQKILR